MMENTERFDLYRAMIEDSLCHLIPDSPVPYKKLVDSMRYSLMAGGKRLRPMLVLEFCRVCGGDIKAVIGVACGVELLHTYSLIHDDLPCMDDDDYRRGKPSNHKVFGETTAVLAGDALQAMAFESILGADIPPERRARCAAILASCAGISGICGGQQLDIEWEGRKLSEDELLEIHTRKTAALIRAACLMGVAAAGAEKEREAAAIRYADALGLAFQVRDDVLDVIGSQNTLGKPIGSDKQQRKNTFVDLFGIEGCNKIVYDNTYEAKKAVVGAFSDTAFLIWLADQLADRKN